MNLKLYNMAVIKTSKGDFYFKPQIVYLGIKQIDKQIAFENLKVVSEIMNKSGLNWGPVFGTLLGIIRDNDFITWDEDIDLYVLNEDKEKFLPLLFDFKNAGFEVIRNWRCGLISIKRNGEYIDFYFVKKLEGNIMCSTGDAFYFDKYFKDTIVWDFKGIKFNIPREYEEFLEFQYGDWKTPVQYCDFEMNVLQKWKMITYLYFVNHIPNWIYYPLFRHHHQQHLDKFKAKCAAKGIMLPDNLSLNNYHE